MPYYRIPRIFQRPSGLKRDTDTMAKSNTGNTGWFTLTITVPSILKSKNWNGWKSGSTLDGKGGVFYWQTAAGFLGNYEFTFVREVSGGEIKTSNKIDKGKDKNHS